MSYDTWLEGTLALTPFPDEEATSLLRVALAAPTDPAAGRLTLTPLAHGIVCEDAVDWEAACAALEEARAAIFEPAGLKLMGTLRAMGEDGMHLATVFVEADQIRIERHEVDDEPDFDEWLADLHADDPELRCQAAAALADSNTAGTIDALAVAARSDTVEAVRCRALESLGTIGEDAASALATLVDCLRDQSPLVRYWATFALGRLGPAANSALPALERLTAERSDGPRFGAIDAIRRVRGTR